MESRSQAWLGIAQRLYEGDGTLRDVTWALALACEDASEQELADITGYAFHCGISDESLLDAIDMFQPLISTW